MDNSVDAGSEFIDKILGEMKNTFNKTENKQVTLVQVQSTTEIIPTIEKNGNLGVTISDIIENNVENVQEENLNKGSSISRDIKIETIEIDVNSLVEDDASKRDMNGDSTNDVQTNSSLCFRKPVPFSKPKRNCEQSTSRRSLRNKLSEETELKRSARRRKSKDYSESVLQSAIARKEKSYNESNKPQRLTKQLKPTQKILQNLAAIRDKTKTKPSKLTEKQKRNDNDSDINVSIEDSAMQIDEGLQRKHKHGNGKHTKRGSKKVKNNHSENGKDSDSDQNISLEINICESIIENDKVDCKTAKIKTNEERNYRRSQRISSSRREDLVSNVDDIEIPEPSLADQESMFPADPVCSSVGAELIASKLCLCTQPTQIYADAADEVMFCTAVDNVSGKLVGCNHVVNNKEVAMVRPSFRVPYVILCDVHRNRMLRHNCCPTCGLFCTQGKFVECENKHQYHRDCQISVGDIQCCPHCGSTTPEHNVSITMYSAKKPVFLTKQRLSYPPAKITFQSQSHNDENMKRSTSPLIPFGAIQFSTVTNSPLLSCDIETILHAIDNKNYNKLATILGSRSVSLMSPLQNEDGTTILHYSAKNGYLPAVHMLYMAGMELNILDKDQNTPLMVAVLQFKNNVVKYLIKAGANIHFKGTDGMTALHLAAEYGNLGACELLIDSALDKNHYVNCADDGGWTSLVWACEHNHLIIAKYLLRKGANPLLRDLKQNVALHWAAFSGCQEIVELLINYGSDVNVVNVQGDTPLHNAARQDNYNAIIILLIRGGSISVANNMNETPLDCAQPQSDCYKIIMLNVHLQMDNKSKPNILCNDISRGKELNPIQCVNYVDDFPKPVDFAYVTQYCTTSDINFNRKINSIQSCSCDDNCDGSGCLCAHNSLSKWYNEEGRLLPTFNFADAPMIFECNQVCTCNVLTCKNRIVQRGPTQRFQLYRTRTKGWGICTLNLIEKGGFVCEYIGEIVPDTEADQREDDSYFFDLDNRENETYCIDAKKYSNFARFINHSCDPNLIPIKVFTDHHDLRFPRIAFFAGRDILPNEEISFDYGEKFWLVKYKQFTCDCKSMNCKYSEETITYTVEKHNQHVQRLDETKKCNIFIDKIN